MKNSLDKMAQCGIVCLYAKMWGLDVFGEDKR